MAEKPKPHLLRYIYRRKDLQAWAITLINPITKSVKPKKNPDNLNHHSHNKSKIDEESKETTDNS